MQNFIPTIIVSIIFSAHKELSPVEEIVILSTIITEVLRYLNRLMNDNITNGEKIMLIAGKIA